jgi:hypothetical protein
MRLCIPNETWEANLMKPKKWQGGYTIYRKPALDSAADVLITASWWSSLIAALFSFF